MTYKDDKGNTYIVGRYLGNDPAKHGLYHVTKIDGHNNRHTPGPLRLNPWTTEEQAEANLLLMARHNGRKKRGD